MEMFHCKLSGFEHNYRMLCVDGLFCLELGEYEIRSADIFCNAFEGSHWIGQFVLTLSLN